MKGGLQTVWAAAHRQAVSALRGAVKRRLKAAMPEYALYIAAARLTRLLIAWQDNGAIAKLRIAGFAFTISRLGCNRAWIGAATGLDVTACRQGIISAMGVLQALKTSIACPVAIRGSRDTCGVAIQMRRGKRLGLLATRVRRGTGTAVLSLKLTRRQRDYRQPTNPNPHGSHSLAHKA